ncbi:uncharacterized protein MEPE_03118 [Melanopsichium pennsylvanicum]|uniref:Uncharacterized protein n=1 Tax=Melanopsichium pennsylvanicum TaxID=63383 RepID=A0AAJ4XL81_9BASI|nr:uncharacterized protein MEPE_03118 [Melanopsichium pennsylvanicum]
MAQVEISMVEVEKMLELDIEITQSSCLPDPLPPQPKPHNPVATDVVLVPVSRILFVGHYHDHTPTSSLTCICSSIHQLVQHSNVKSNLPLDTDLSHCQIPLPTVFPLALFSSKQTSQHTQQQASEREEQKTQI